jgi:hypothetical protein
MIEKSFAYCGINCNECPARIATVKDDAPRKKQQRNGPGFTPIFLKVLEYIV